MLFRYMLKSFISFLLIFSVVVAIISFLKILLYKNEDKSRCFTIETHPIDKKYYLPISENDVVFDSITKRRIGRVEAVNTTVSDGDIILKLDIIGSLPSTLHSAFSSGVWFEYEVVEQ